MTTGTLADYIRADTIANRPAAPSVTGVTHGSTRFYATDTGIEYAWDGVAWQIVKGGALASASALLSADVTMTSANTFYDGPTVSLAAGSWMVHAGLMLVDGATSNITFKLWDGTTAYASGERTTASGGAFEQMTLAAIVAPGTTTTYKMSAASAGTGCTLKAAAPNNGAGNNALWIYALRFA